MPSCLPCTEGGPAPLGKCSPVADICLGLSSARPTACRKKLLEALQESNADVIATLAADQHYALPSSVKSSAAEAVQAGVM